ncbi:MAG: hypothetical protein O3B86_11450, partial [Planctomycetota bacterium]|nr:hypothetical protein [Planctomycetota bacterium]
LDRNQDGRIDEDEVERIPGPMRDAIVNMGGDLRRGISRDRFAELMPRAMDEMRRSRESGGGFGGPPGGGFGGPPGGGFGGPPGYGDRGFDGRGSDDNRGRSDDRSKDGKSRSDSRGDSRSRSDRNAPKTPVRITLDLPEAWKAADLDRDGQIGLYEWDRRKFAEFFALDTNHDSLLTPHEISRAQGASPAPSTQFAATISEQSSSATAASGTRNATQPSAKPTTVAAPVSKREPLTAAEFDAASAEGRWAKYVFGKLDLNKDGSLTQEEWSKSQTTRISFEKFNARVTFPAKLEDFAGMMVAVQRAEKSK